MSDTKILIVTQEEPFFIPKILRLLSKKLPKEHTIAGVIVLKPYHKGKTRTDWVEERSAFYSSKELILVGMAYGWARIFNRQSHSVRRSSESLGWRVFNIDDINSKEFIDVVRKEDVDLVVSISATQVFKKDALEAPKIGCVNVHGSLLAKHRGVQGTWWALAERDEETGTTVHYMVENLDSGNIITQRKVKINSNDTQFLLAARTKVAGMIALIDALPLIEQKQKGQPMELSKGSFHTFPTKDDAKMFRARGKRIIVWDDVKMVLPSDFPSGHLLKIMIDIGHPAHVHFFKNAIWELQKHGHKVIITARDKDVTLRLLDAYKLPYICRGPGGIGTIGKGLGMIITDYHLFNIARKFKPNIMMGITNPYTAQVSRLVGAKSITFTDTEHARSERRMTLPFTDRIVTPSAYLLEHGEKHIRYNGYHELAYLHPNRFTPDPRVLEELKLSKEDKFAIIRFVSWQASHDIGLKGISLEDKVKLVKEIEKHAIPLITSEGKIPEELQRYQIRIPPHRIHNALYYAHLYVGEGATMASESAMLGIPSIYVNILNAGTLKEQAKYGLVHNYRNANGVVDNITELFTNKDLKAETIALRDRMLQDKIDVTAWIVNLIENESMWWC